VPANSWCSYLHGAMVQVTVGLTVFWVHMELLKARSKFFEEALNSHTAHHDPDQGENRTIKMPHVEPNVFATYLHFIYYGLLPILLNDSECDSNHRDQRTPELHTRMGQQAGEEYYLLAQLYVFAEMVKDQVAKHTIFDAFFGIATRPRVDGRMYAFGPRTIALLRAGTPRTDPIRDCLVDYYASYAGSFIFQGTEESEFPPGFLFDLAKKVCGERNPPADWDRMRVDFEGRLCQAMQRCQIGREDVRGKMIE
jgi:hypothetical protein